MLTMLGPSCLKLTFHNFVIHGKSDSLRAFSSAARAHVIPGWPAGSRVAAPRTRKQAKFVFSSLLRHYNDEKVILEWAESCVSLFDVDQFDSQFCLEFLLWMIRAWNINQVHSWERDVISKTPAKPPNFHWKEKKKSSSFRLLSRPTPLSHARLQLTSTLNFDRDELSLSLFSTKFNSSLINAINSRVIPEIDVESEIITSEDCCFMEILLSFQTSCFLDVVSGFMGENQFEITLEVTNQCGKKESLSNHWI